MADEWAVYDIGDGAEVLFAEEFGEHQPTEVCICGPAVERYDNGRMLIVHKRMDN